MKISVPSLILPALFIIILYLFRHFLRRGQGRHGRNLRTARKVYRTLQDLPDRSIIPYLRKVDPFVFEELVLLSFRRKGYRTIRNIRYTGDGGVDGRVYIDGRLFLVQDKRYKGYVDPSDVRDFDDLCRGLGIPGIFVHTGRTGAASRDIAQYSPRIIILSGHALVELMKGDAGNRGQKPDAR